VFAEDIYVKRHSKNWLSSRAKIAPFWNKCWECPSSCVVLHQFTNGWSVSKITKCIHPTSCSW